jgi:hypothetical protein
MVSDKISVGKLVVHDGHREPALCGCEQKEVAHPSCHPSCNMVQLFDFERILSALLHAGL